MTTHPTTNGPERMLGTRPVGQGHPVYVTGEIGINHNGDVDNALRLIDAAAAAGCDAVKFQKRTPEVCTPRDQWDLERDTPWGRMRYIDYRHRVEFGEQMLRRTAQARRAEQGEQSGVARGTRDVHGKVDGGAHGRGERDAVVGHEVPWREPRLMQHDPERHRGGRACGLVHEDRDG